MCGIVAVYDSREKMVDMSAIISMRETMLHRGPDDEGVFDALPWGALAFRRLSIIDIAGGHQPIGNEDDTVQVILNGEIYNYRELTEELRRLGHVFRTHSDTEVIVHAYEQYGDRFAEHLRGIFGLAVLDIRRKRLLVARDRLGVKPLYWWQKDGLFLFASEIKALLTHPYVSCEVNWASVGEYLAMRYALGPETMFEGIQQVPPATVITVQAGGMETTVYWRDIPVGPMIEDSVEALEVFGKSLEDAVRSQMISDVPVGLFLSGGVDSTALLAVMAQFNGRGVKTFTANLGSNEATDVKNARTAAAYFGAEHFEIYLEPKKSNLLEKIVWHLDQPVADPAALPTMLLAQAAQREVTVVLTGEGSDEVNGGYNRYLRRAAFESKESLIRFLIAAWPLVRKFPSLRNRVEGFMPLVAAKTEAEQCVGAADALVGMLNGEVLQGARNTAAKIKRILDESEAKTSVERMQYLERHTWMSECTLIKTDRMTMAASVEARVPFLDHKFVEQALRIHPRLRVGNRQTKLVLREWLRKAYPPSAARSQSGFILPLAQWSRDPEFIRVVCDLLSKERFIKRGVLEPNAARHLVKEFLNTGRHANQIWRLICLEVWFQKFFD
jgi:asparagine synthase (glutamine-hydrolysing)